MAETVVLGIVVAALLVERFLSNRAHDQEVARLTSAVIAKNAGELRLMDNFWEAPKEPAYAPPQPVLPDGYEGQAGIS